VPLLRNGPIDRRRASLRRAEASVQVADSSLGEARLAALRTGGSRYIDWVGAGLRRQVAQSLFDLAKVRDEGLQVRVQRGDIPAIERIDNQRALWQRQGLQVAAQRSVEQAALELSLFLRDEQGSPVLVRDSRLPPQLPRPERTNFGDPAQVQADQKIAQEQRPELRKLAQQRRQLEIERDLAKNQLWPSADLSASVSQDFGPPGYPRDKTVLDLSLSLDIPTLNRAARGRLAQAEAALQRFVAQQRLIVDRINLEVADVHSQLAQAIRRVELAERELDLAQQVERAERAKFELGDSTLLNVNLREQATFDAALRRIDALVELHRAKIIHQAVLGNEG
jgi:cobalt-zinc-cadmium efflux system outer membrane protein